MVLCARALLLRASLLWRIGPFVFTGILMALSPTSTAQKVTRPVALVGSNSNWIVVAPVPRDHVIQVFAVGEVKFGLFSTTDAPDAGVDGNPVFRLWQSLSHGPQRTSHSLRYPVNFNQGGVWIKIVAQRSAREAIAPTLYYYWQHFFNFQDVRFLM